MARRAGAKAAEGEGLRDRILAAAVDIFAEHGIHAGTVRMITQRVGCNIAALNYHFGSKEMLARKVLDRVMGPLEARIGLLDGFEAAAGDAPLPVEKIVEALIRPMVQMTRDSGGGRPLIKLLQQARVLPRAETSEFFVERVNPIVERFIDALARSLPGLSRAELYWRYSFASGSVLHVLVDADPARKRLKVLTGGLCDTDDDEAIVAQLVAFVASGMRAGTVQEREP